MHILFPDLSRTSRNHTSNPDAAAAETGVTPPGLHCVSSGLQILSAEP